MQAQRAEFVPTERRKVTYRFELSEKPLRLLCALLLCRLACGNSLRSRLERFLDDDRLLSDDLMRCGHEPRGDLHRRCFQLGIGCDSKRQCLDRFCELIEGFLQLRGWLELDRVNLDGPLSRCWSLGCRLLGSSGGSCGQAGEQNEKKSKAFHDC